MLDIRTIREQPERVKTAAINKNAAISIDQIDQLLELDQQRRNLIIEVENVRQKRNELSTELKQTKPSSEQIQAGKKLKDELSELEDRLAKVEQEYVGLLKLVPNLPTGDVPIGKTEDENVVAKTVGAKPAFDFEPKNHWQLAEAKGWIDKERAAKVAGSRFAYLKGDLVRLHMALIAYAMDVLTSETTLKRIATEAGLTISTKPFVPVLPPLMIRTDMYDAMDRLEPRDDRYKLEGEDMWLQGSAEHVLGSMHAGEIISEDQLPLRYVGYATSFRREAGTYGKDMEGIFRLHQFDKLEMESLTTAETSLDEHYFMIAIQEYLMTQLQLPYQVILKCTADIGKPNARGVDINTWLPGQNKYRETHTADYMTDYQARRLQTRVRRASGEVELAHTNDATAFSQRPLIAILENYQLADGSIQVPSVLAKYYGREQI